MPPARIALAAALLGAACGGESLQKYPFRDERGRECVRTCSGSRCGDDCDEPPVPAAGCTDSDPCFTVADGPLDGAGATGLLLCDACCTQTGTGTEFAWVYEDCSPVVCEIPADCPIGQHRCEDGRCVPEG